MCNAIMALKSNRIDKEDFIGNNSTKYTQAHAQIKQKKS